MRNKFTLSEQVVMTINSLPTDEQKLEMFMKVSNYALNDEKIESDDALIKSMSILIQEQVDRDNFKRDKVRLNALKASSSIKKNNI